LRFYDTVLLLFLVRRPHGWLNALRLILSVTRRFLRGNTVYELQFRLFLILACGRLSLIPADRVIFTSLLQALWRHGEHLSFSFAAGFVLVWVEKSARKEKPPELAEIPIVRIIKKMSRQWQARNDGAVVYAIQQM